MNQERAAQSLGVNRLTAFLKVTAPQIKGSIIAGALFAFISSLDEVVVSLFVSGGPTSTLSKAHVRCASRRGGPHDRRDQLAADFRQSWHRTGRHGGEPKDVTIARQLSLLPIACGRPRYCAASLP